MRCACMSAHARTRTAVTLRPRAPPLPTLVAARLAAWLGLRGGCTHLKLSAGAPLCSTTLDSSSMALGSTRRMPGTWFRSNIWRASMPTAGSGSVAALSPALLLPLAGPLPLRGGAGSSAHRTPM